jgi:hypothetical protein
MAVGGECVGCGAAESDARLCVKCTEELRNLLWRIACTHTDGSGARVLCLLDELQITLSRQAKVVQALTTSTRRSEAPLPLDLRAAAVAQRIQQALQVAAIVAGWPRRTWPRPGVWLAMHTERLRQRADSGVLLDDLTRLEEAGHAAIDHPPSRWYAGVCGTSRGATCQGDLWVSPGLPYVQCPRCQMRHDVEERKAWLARVVEDSLATATEISRAVHLLDRPVTASMIWKYAHRKRLTSRGQTSRGEPLYRIGDVLAVLRETSRGNV